ncbi:MAG: hypothetical protein RLZZ453_292 [Chlamydiota bacterium]|jgi:GNAT superfamily N-acetyltransferase
MLLMTDIHVRSFSGQSLAPYTHSLMRLRHEVLKDYPYFEEVDPQLEIAYMKRLLSSRASMSVLVFDNTTLVGGAFGSPLEEENSSIHQPLIDKGLNISEYYFLSEVLLLKPYRGRGIGHHFFDARESFAEQLHRFKYLCFYAPVQQEPSPSDFVPMHDFWRKRGYIHHAEMQFSLKIKRVDLLHPQDTYFTFWIKPLVI